MKLPVPLSFDWDEGNKDKSWHKHGMYYKEIEEIFFNRPIIIFVDKKHSQEEKRLLAYGKTNDSVQLTVIFTIRDQKIRVISARKQNKKERNMYEQHNS